MCVVGQFRRMDVNRFWRKRKTIIADPGCRLTKNRVRAQRLCTRSRTQPSTGLVRLLAAAKITEYENKNDRRSARNIQTRPIWSSLCLLVIFLSLGCGDSNPPRTGEPVDSRVSKDASSPPLPSNVGPNQGQKNNLNSGHSDSFDSGLPSPPSDLNATSLQNPPPAPKSDKGTAKESPSSTTVDLKDDSDPYLPRRKLGPLTAVDVDVARLGEFGLRHSESDHLRLITDLPEADVPADFHAIFTQAIGQWVAFCEADSRRFEKWQLTCFLIVDEAKFQNAGLLPAKSLLPAGTLPPGGWQVGNQIWVRQHQGPYYTRHMLLHEATHAFFAFNYGALGSPWLAEGLAEYFAVHRWADGKLQMAARVVDKNELPYWGRVKLIRDAYQTGQPKSLLEVIKFPPNAFPHTESYAWSWAAVSLFAAHPQLKGPFSAQLRKLGQISDTQWNRELVEALALDRRQLETQWQVDTTTLQYGHDFSRTAIQWQESKLADANEYQFTLPADGAWHATGWRLPTGQWEIVADGTYQVAKSEETSWNAQPNGITIRYVLGAPLGQVQYALQGDPAILQGLSELTNPLPVGVRTVVQTTGEELFLRVNDSPNQLEDNLGQVAIVIRRL